VRQSPSRCAGRAQKWRKVARFRTFFEHPYTRVHGPCLGAVSCTVRRAEWVGVPASVRSVGQVVSHLGSEVLGFRPEARRKSDVYPTSRGSPGLARRSHV
jgi:hypothetical protein